MSELRVIRAGLVDYDEALSWQNELWSEVRAAPARSYLLLLRHPPIYTIGRNGDAANVLASHSIPVRRVDRGGDVTYHGPGQLIAYPIMSLRTQHLGVRRYMHRLEQTVIDSLVHFGIQAKRKPDCVGVWTTRGKIASLGVRVGMGVTRHGLAVQVADESEPFEGINPCGVPDCPLTSIEREVQDSEATHSNLLMRRFTDRFVPQFARRFGMTTEPMRRTNHGVAEGTETYSL